MSHPILRADVILEDYIGSFSEMFPRIAWLYSLDPGKHAQATCAAPSTPQVALRVTLSPPIISVKTIYHPYYGACDKTIQFALTDPEGRKKVQERLAQIFGETNGS